VILATMQKEQGVVTQKAPTDYALRYAMGYACPDSSGCSDANAGLGVQIYQGARQLMTYKVSNEVWKYKPSTSPQFVAYHPDYYVNGRCGGTQVVIRNFATAALYNYTPYQPNAAALANMGGTGDNCSSYGNRNFWSFYSDWFGNPLDLVPGGVTVSRIGGSDRYQVAAGVSAAYFPSGVSTVYVASGELFPDAISAGPAAAASGGPVLIVERNRIPDSIASELRRLAPARIVVVGGPATVADSVLGELAAYAPTVERIGGANRYEVSRNIVSDTFDAAAVAYLATGAVFADALSSGAAAGSKEAPVILVDGSLSKIVDATWALLERLGVSQVKVAGGPGSVSSGIFDSLVAKLGPSSVTRFGGANRFAVSTAVNKDAFTSAATFFVASGDSFPDALSATPAAVATGSPLYVTQQSCLSRDQIQHMIDAGATRLVVVGGPASVSEVAAQFRNC
jgi:putative cell wall-binding protein